jgi:hypothetical protein
MQTSRKNSSTNGTNQKTQARIATGAYRMVCSPDIPSINIKQAHPIGIVVIAAGGRGWESKTDQLNLRMSRTKTVSKAIVPFRWGAHT